ncbi:hypothetical protein ACMD2_01226 [Ananas comosus]|uniref:Uncharacterized protein n=1 Tax=Ananas comosus TaxID=4615 RepID=A0A199UDG6_ANACO|nr:hypothetical protein ACMD2_01226 [Ananas comosus]
MVAAAAIMPPFSKPAPSKWDDAQKWIASPNLNRVGKAWRNAEEWIIPGTKVVVEVTEELGTKRIDHNQAKVSCCVPDPYPEWRIFTLAAMIRLHPFKCYSIVIPVNVRSTFPTGTPLRSTTPTRSPNSSGHQLREDTTYFRGSCPG